MVAFYYSSSGGRPPRAPTSSGSSSPTCRRVRTRGTRCRPSTAGSRARSRRCRWRRRSASRRPVVDVQVVPTASGRPASVTLVKKTGESILLKAADVRARLGLRSTAFRIGVLRVAPPPATRAAGAPVVVSGFARDVDAPLLEKLAVNGSWQPSVEARPGQRRLLRRHRTPEVHRPRTGSRPTASRGRRSPSPFRRDRRSDLEGVGPLAAVVVVLVAAPTVDAARFAVGVAPSADRCRRRRAPARPGGARSHGPRADPRARGLGARASVLRGVAGTRYVELLGARRAAYEPERPIPTAPVVCRAEPRRSTRGSSRRRSRPCASP